MTTMSLPMTQSCFDKRNLKDSIVLETESFKLTVGKDALVRSLIVKKTNKEMVLGGAGATASEHQDNLRCQLTLLGRREIDRRV